MSTAVLHQLPLFDIIGPVSSSNYQFNRAKQASCLYYSSRKTPIPSYPTGVNKVIPHAFPTHNLFIIRFLLAAFESNTRIRIIRQHGPSKTQTVMVSSSTGWKRKTAFCYLSQPTAEFRFSNLCFTSTLNQTSKGRPLGN